MSNEFLIIFSFIIYFGGMLLLFYLFGKRGLIVWNCLTVILSSIEGLVLVDSFGLTMTLGNVCVASSFLATDLLCERYGKKSAEMSILLAFLIGIIFVLFTQYWMLFTPSIKSNGTLVNVKEIFAYSPRIILSSLLVRMISQLIDVRLYYIFWSISNKYADKKRHYLWFRNNFSTIASQLVYATFFNIFAFYGIIENNYLITVILSSFIIYTIISIIDTPILYFACRLEPKGLLNDE